MFNNRIADFLRSRNEGAEPKVITTYAPPVIKKVMLQPIIYETGTFILPNFFNLFLFPLKLC